MKWGGLNHSTFWSTHHLSFLSAKKWPVAGSTFYFVVVVICARSWLFFFLEIQHNTVPSLRACLSIGSLHSGENRVGLNLDLYGGHVYHLFLLFKPFLPTSSSFLFFIQVANGGVQWQTNNQYFLLQFERWRISVAYNEDRLGYTLNIGGYLQWHKYGP